MRVLVVGAGSIGNRHLDNLYALGIRDVSICDKEESRLAKVQEKYPDLTLYDDYMEVLEESDSVFICTPAHVHTEILKKAVEFNCHVFCEKPLAMDLSDLDNIEALALEKNLIIMIGYVMRFFEPVKKIREILSSKSLGKIYSARTIVSQYLPDWHPSEDYRDFFLSHKARGGGSLLEESHAIDYMRWLLGDVKSVCCNNRKLSDLEMDCEDISILNLEFQSGALVTIQVDLLGRVLRREAEFSCERGTVIWDDERSLVRVYKIDTSEWLEFQLSINPDAYIDEIKHFFDCIVDRSEPLIPLRDGIEVLRVCMAAFKSSDERRLVRIEEIDESTVVQRVL